MSKRPSLFIEQVSFQLSAAIASELLLPFFLFQIFFAMYKLLAFLTSFAAVCTCVAQSKRDKIWIMGNSGTPSTNYVNTETIGGMMVDFSNPTVTFEKFNIKGGPPHATANDENGNLQFYYNYCWIMNKEHDFMDNGGELNLGSWGEINECRPYGSHFGIRSGALVFPFPNSEKRYILIHLAAHCFPYLPIHGFEYCLSDDLQYTEIDMSANGGLGRVVKKNQQFLADSLNDAIAAVRHGNGRDWWVMIPRGTNREFWQFMIGPNGISTPQLLSFPPPPPPVVAQEVDFEYLYESWGSQARFSPDGTKYARSIRDNGTEIYDFDRCTGDMKFRRMLPLAPISPNSNSNGHALVLGCCFSPNSRYLYYNTHDHLMQFDLCEDNLNNPKSEGLLIDVFNPDTGDVWLDYLSNFFLMRNVPNGKIYMNATNSSNFLHVIENPDLPGQMCNFKQRGLRLPRGNAWIWSDFQNFNLLDMPNSPCDSLGIDGDYKEENLPDVEEFVVYPNPTDEIIHFYIPSCMGGPVKIWNASGQLIKEFSLIPGETDFEFSVKTWSAGVYMVVFNPFEGNHSIARKLIKTD